MPNWDEIRKEWETTKVTFKSLAEKYEVKDSTIRSRKNREKWQRNDATQRKNVATKGKPHRAPKGNKYAVGNRGNPDPTPKFPKRNTEAVKHGFFSKFLPPETLEIMESMNERSPADLIWDQIQIQYAAIISAQQIMYVRDRDDMSSEIVEESLDKTKYEIQFAWDKQATFMNAQSRAMSELRNLIKQFDEMAHIDDERRLKLEGMRLGIEKTKTEVESLKGDNEKDSMEGWVAALKEVADRRRKLREKSS